MITEAEHDLPQRHLIARNVANGSAKIENPHPAVSIFNFHYATPPIAVGQNYHFNKVIGDNETGFNGNADSTYRKEGWAFMFAGGGLYNNLDYSFTADNEDGTFQYPPSQPGGGSPALRRQLGYLHNFLSSFNYLGMKPDSSLISDRLHIKTMQVLAEPGKQYGVYIFGKGPINLQLSLPAGTYQVEFMDPLSGKSEKAEPVTSDGQVTLTTPAYPEDVAIKIINN